MTGSPYRTLAGSQSLAAATRHRAVAVLGALFGLFLIFGVGFAHSGTIHNAAHDARHSFAFPCH